MSEQGWSKIEEIFEVLADRPPEEWDRVIDEACGEDAELRREVESLARHASASESFFGDLARRVGLPRGEADAELLVGRRVGLYRLQRLLGRGGMGAVYLGVRTEGDFEVRAAVKLVAMGLLDASARRRFLAERSILSRLVHPNIARLFDGGLTEDGTPYFVMEYVEGPPIDQYCDAGRLDVRARVRLMLTVCEAVEFAHRNMIVHRDLKPENILVTEGGDPKLLDFGIARALNAGGPTPHTVTLRPRPMTVAWASPEQVKGEPVSTATDVYGLGLLLYRLLTGRHPYRVRGRSYGDVERAVCNTDPAPLAAGLSDASLPGDADAKTPGEIARRRGTTPGKLRRLLAGDLGRIVLTALRKEPERRYGTVAALAEDLRRYLGGFPVTARPDTTSYRLGRFVKRHRGSVVAAAAVLFLSAAVVVLGVRYTLQTKVQAEHIAAEAATTAEVFDFLLGVLRLADPGAGSGDTLTVRAALQQGIADHWEHFTDRPEMQVRLLRVVANVYSALGLDVDATALLHQAVALQSESGTLGDTVLASTVQELATSYQRRGRLADAHALFLQARDLLTRVGADSAAVAYAAVGAGIALTMDAQPELGAELTGPALEVLRRRVPGDDRRLWVSMLGLARTLAAQTKLDSAAVLTREVITLAQAAGEEGGSTMAQSLNNLGYYLRRSGEFEDAEAAYRRALDEYGRWIPPSERFTLLGNLGSVLDQRGDTAGTLETFRRRVVFVRQAWPDGNWRIGQSSVILARAYLKYGLVAEAEGPLREAVDSYAESLGTAHGWTARTESELGEVLATLGRPEEAEPYLLRAYGKLRAGPGPDDPWAREAAGRLATFYEARGRREEAARYRVLAGDQVLAGGGN